MEAAGRDAFKPGKLVGNGAYKLDDYRPGDRLTLSRNANYRDAKNVAIEREEWLRSPRHEGAVLGIRADEDPPDGAFA